MAIALDGLISSRCDGRAGLVLDCDRLVLAGAVAASVSHRPMSRDHFDHVIHTSSRCLTVSVTDCGGAARVSSARLTGRRRAGIAWTFHSLVTREVCEAR